MSINQFAAPRAPGLIRRRALPLRRELQLDDLGEPLPVAAAQPPEPVRADSGSAVYHLAFTWNRWDDGLLRPPALSDSEFRDRHGDVRSALSSLGAKYIFQLERGATGRLHFQGYMHLGKGAKERPAGIAKKLSLAGLYGIHVAAASTAGQAALKAYCMKADTRQAGPYKDTDPKPLSPEEHKRLGLISIGSLHPWQEYVRDRLLEPPSDRHIHWIVDTRGCTGKSSFGKLLAAKAEALMLPYTDAKDCLNIVANAGERCAYIFDLTRTKPASISSTDTYSCMEQIKNGYIVNTKYQTKVVIQPSAHVWVFSNEPPQYAALSKDRWRVHTIGDDHQLKDFSPKAYRDFVDKRKIDHGVSILRAAKRQKLIDARVKEIFEADPDGDELEPTQSPSTPVPVADSDCEILE